MTKYDVHIYREIKLRFDGIEADSMEAAADKARQAATADADDIDECDGQTFCALVDVAGDEQYHHSRFIDFEPQRLLDAAPHLLDALRTVVAMEYDRDAESRNFDDERLAYFSTLIAKAEGRAA
jgi:hypothetical protein